MGSTVVETVCPVCGEPAAYCDWPDRYFHLDGSDNRRCWVVIVRGAHQPYRGVEHEDHTSRFEHRSDAVV